MKDKIIQWLGIKEPVDYSEKIELFDEKMENYKLLLDKFTEVKCSGCSKLIKTYPLGGGYYREADGTIYCSGKCLNGRKK